MTESREFGAALRRERERRGISLEAVADRTKIGLALLAGLERGDLARWPTGIFRRAFVRSYAEAVGLTAEEVVARFEQVFAERAEADASTPAQERLIGAGDPLRLTLAGPPQPPARAWLLRGAAATTDLLVVGGAASLAAWLSQQPVAVVVMLAGAGYFALGTLLFESTPAAWVIRRLQRPRHAVAAQEAEADVATAAEGLDARRAEAPMRLGLAYRDRRQGRPERRRVPRPTQRPQ